jgi:hypothetical protein
MAPSNSFRVYFARSTSMAGQDRFLESLLFQTSQYKIFGLIAAAVNRLGNMFNCDV